MACKGLRSEQNIISHPFFNPESEMVGIFIQSSEPRAALHRVMCFVQANSEVLSHFKGSSSDCVIP